MAVTSGALPGRTWAVQRPLPRPAIAAPAAEVRPRELRNTVALLVAILLISVISLLYMNQAGRLATSGYQISNLQDDRDRLQRENESLEVQLSQLRALPHVEQIAKQKLQMTKGELAKVQYVQLDGKQAQLASLPDATQK
jgi:cell division protein FtsL